MIWDYGDMVGRRLVLWAVGSMVLGASLLALGDAWLRGFGLQALAWGAIDGGIGLFGRRAAGRGRQRAGDDPAAPAREARRLRRLLLVNAALDVGYVALGLVIAGPVAAGDAFLEGTGWGIVVQGGFLLAFDLLHARRVPDAP